MEKSCSEDINELRYIPYIQLHEFEGLLFTKMDGFELIPAINNDPIKISELQEILINYPNPELINEGSITAPSKRLSNIIPGYRKTTLRTHNCFRKYFGISFRKVSTIQKLD
ncbi:MAG: DUF4276 family protein [Ignavibacteria bacterium]|nr:DUF4276 family protein [Ignavibacteria bacterium]